MGRERSTPLRPMRPEKYTIVATYFAASSLQGRGCCGNQLSRRSFWKKKLGRHCVATQQCGPDQMCSPGDFHGYNGDSLLPCGLA